MAAMFFGMVGLSMTILRVRDNASLKPGPRDGKYLRSMLDVDIVAPWLFLHEEPITLQRSILSIDNW